MSILCMHQFRYHEWISVFSFHHERQLHDDVDRCAVETEMYEKYSITNKKSYHLFIKMRSLLINSKLTGNPIRLSHFIRSMPLRWANVVQKNGETETTIKMFEQLKYLIHIDCFFETIFNL